MELLPEPLVVPEPPPPDPDALARTQALLAEHRAAHDAARPDRVAVIALGPAVADPDAAADCPCSCHPRPADRGLHDGGATCACQPVTDETRAQRAAALDNLFALREELGIDDTFDAETDAFNATAAELGVDATLTCFACPTVINGAVDGHRFAVRERHDDYRVVVDPTGAIADLHTHSPGAFLIAAGDATLLNDGGGPAALLVESVTAVRTWAQRNTCSHDRGPDGAAYCCDCGLQLRDNAT